MNEKNTNLFRDCRRRYEKGYGENFTEMSNRIMENFGKSSMISALLFLLKDKDIK